MIHVSAGIITRPDGRVLVCQRGEGRKNAHLWEFPGGKQEAGESPADCLARELQEELGLRVKDVRPVCEGTAQGIHFTFLACEALNEPVATEHEDIRFVAPREMLRLPFCPADVPVAENLALHAPRLRHFFWDFDGTLLDTYPLMTSLLGRACKHCGFTETQERLLDLMKENLRYAVETLAAEHGISADDLANAYRAEEAQTDYADVRPIVGIPEALLALKRLGGRHYLVTHRGRSALDMLERLGMKPMFTDFVTSEDGFPRKPQPDSCLHLLHKHGIDPKEAVMIGDRPLDTAAGRAAGMLSCLLDEEGRFPDDPCELRVQSAAELPGRLIPRPIPV